MADAGTTAGFFTWTREAQIVLQPGGTVVAWNPAAARLLQIPAATAIGRPLTALLPGLADLLTPAELPPSAAPDWQRRTLVLRDGTDLEVDAAIARHDGHVLVILANCRAPLPPERTSQAPDQQQRSMLDALPIGFTIVSLRDERYPTLYQNDWGIDVSGWGNDEWERDPDFSLTILHPDDRDRMVAFREEFRQALGPFDVEYRVVRPDGGVVWLRDWGTVVYDTCGAPDCLVVCLLDITAQKQAELALRDALHDLSAAHAEVKALSAAKSTYLSILSHEFRTPLTSIRRFSELIAGGGLPADEVQQFAGVIDANAQRLARMITDLLDMDRLESGQRRLRQGEVHLSTLILEVLETIAGLDHPHEITLRIAEDLPPIQADGDLLMQLVTNLVTNAIKYTPVEGQIVIDVAQAGTDAIEIAITDSGPGIPQDALETVFRRFARLARDERRPIEGSGLGLPIARQIADLHGGRIWAENIESGARFVVRLPIAGRTVLPDESSE